MVAERIWARDVTVGGEFRFFRSDEFIGDLDFGHRYEAGLINDLSYLCHLEGQDPHEWFYSRPGLTHHFKVTYSNQGTATWNNTETVTDPNSVELWACDVNGERQDSPLVPVDWIGGNNPYRVTGANESQVVYRGTANFEFNARIPQMASGDIYAYFRPAHGGDIHMPEWVGMNFPIHVDADDPQAPPNLTVDPSNCSSTNSFYFDWGNSVDYGGSGLKQYRWKINNHMEHITTDSFVQLDGSTGVHPDWNTFYVRAEDKAGEASGSDGNFSDYATVQFCLLGDNNLSFDTDGNDDQVPDGWTVSTHGSCDYAYMNGGPDGTHYMKFVNPDDTGWVHLIHDINGLFQANHTYRLSFWYKTTCTESFGWRLFTGDHQNFLDALGCIVESPLADSQWHYFWGAPFSLTSSQLAEYSCFGARITERKIGTFNFDGVVIEEVELCQ